jgi:hypothetical protein
LLLPERGARSFSRRPQRRPQGQQGVQGGQLQLACSLPRDYRRFFIGYLAIVASTSAAVDKREFKRLMDKLGGRAKNIDRIRFLLKVLNSLNSVAIAVQKGNAVTVLGPYAAALLRAA